MLLSPNLIVIGARLFALTEHDGDLGGVRASELTMISALDWECGVGEWIWMRLKKSTPHVREMPSVHVSCVLWAHGMVFYALNIFLGVRYFSAV